MKRQFETSAVSIPSGQNWIQGDLSIPGDSSSVVIFAHGSGSSRHSRRNRYVADVLNHYGFATLMIDLLTVDEEAIDNQSAEFRFNMDLLAPRLITATNWVVRDLRLSNFSVGYFGASTGAAAALIAAAKRPDYISAVVLRGGRPDLAQRWLDRVAAPTLFIVGELDPDVIALNRDAAEQMHARTEIEIISGASHLFEEPGALEKVAATTREWFDRNLIRRHAA